MSSEKSVETPVLPDIPDSQEKEESKEEKKQPEKIACKCGKLISKKQFNGHLNSGTHIKAMKDLEDEKPKRPNEIIREVIVDKPDKKEGNQKLVQLLQSMNKKLDHIIELNEDIADALFEDDVDLMEPQKKITTKKKK